MQLPVGGCYPIYCTAAGRALLSGLPKPKADEIVEQSEIHRYTPTTLTDKAQIIRLIDDARLTGFAFALGEFFRGDINVAAPIIGADGQAVAAVGVSVPVTRWTFDDARAQLAPQVTEVAQTISSLFPPGGPWVRHRDGTGSRDRYIGVGDRPTGKRRRQDRRRFDPRILVAGRLGDAWRQAVPAVDVEHRDGSRGGTPEMGEQSWQHHLDEQFAPEATGMAKTWLAERTRIPCLKQ